MPKKQLTDKQKYDKLIKSKGYPIRYIYMANLEEDLSEYIDGYEKLSYKEKAKLLRKHIKEYVEMAKEALNGTMSLKSSCEIFNDLIDEALVEKFGDPYANMEDDDDDDEE